MEFRIERFLDWDLDDSVQKVSHNDMRKCLILCGWYLSKATANDEQKSFFNDLAMGNATVTEFSLIFHANAWLAKTASDEAASYKYA